MFFPDSPSSSCQHAQLILGCLQIKIKEEEETTKVVPPGKKCKYLWLVLDVIDLSHGYASKRALHADLDMLIAV